jgi:uncharacterized alpha-E superfamily protein
MGISVLVQKQQDKGVKLSRRVGLTSAISSLNTRSSSANLGRLIIFLKRGKDWPASGCDSICRTRSSTCIVRRSVSTHKSCVNSSFVPTRNGWIAEKPGLYTVSANQGFNK